MFKKIILVAISIIFGCIIGLFLAEIIIRIINPATNVVPTEFDYEIGIHNQRGYSGIYSREGLSHYSINSEGWRDIERSINKPQAIFRIAIVGDSYIEALQVEWKKMIGPQLENMLNQHAKKVQYEVMTFGMSGFDAAQAYLTIKHKIIKFQPDLIIYAFVSGNDLQDSVREIRNIPWKPYFTIKNNQLILDDSYRKFVMEKENRWTRPLVLFLRKNSRLIEYLVYVVYPRFKAYLTNYKKQQFDLSHNNLKVKNELGLSSIDEIYRQPPENSLYQKAWEINERLILEMRSLLLDNNSQFMFFGVTNCNQVSNVVPLPDGYDLYYPEHRLAQFAKENSLYYLPLAEDFARLNKEQDIILHGKRENPGGHWNENGHYYAALKLYEYLITHSELIRPINKKIKYFYQ